jgi:abequosyltransferase
MQDFDKFTVKKQALFTVAIPTYNRASYLDLCLKRLSEELNSLDVDLRKLVNIYISNNASTDETALVIARYPFKDAGKVEIVNNKSNIGAERNVVQCYESAITPYVWILGDDDIILPKGLQKVLEVLLLKQPDIVYLGNYHFVDSYLDHQCAIKPEIDSFTVCENSLEFAKRTNVMLTFISGLVVRRKFNFNYQSGMLADSYLSHLGWILPLLRDGNVFVIIESWVVAAKGGNTGGYGLIKVFAENLQKISCEILRDKPKEAKAIENGTIVNFFPGFILEMRAGRSKFSDVSELQGLKYAFYKNWRYYFFLVPLIKLPLSLAYRYNNLLNILRRFLGGYLI